MSEFLRHNNKFKSICFDFETESLNCVFARPWQLSYLVTEGTTIKETFDKFIWWEDLQVSEGAKFITGFDDNDYKSKAQAPEKILEDFDKYLYDPSYLNIGQNILGFDIFIHNILRKKCGKKTDFSYISRSYDTNLLGKFIKYANPPPIEDNKLKWFYKLLNSYEKGIKTNLKTLAQDNSIEYNPDLAHDAAYDLGVTFDVFKKQILSVDV